MKHVVKIVFLIVILLSACVAGQHSPISSTSALPTDTPIATLTLNSSVPVPPRPSSTPTFTARFTPTPSVAARFTLTPSVTATLTCNYSLEFYTIAYLQSGIQISYDTPLQLEKFKSKRVIAFLSLASKFTGIML